MTNWVSSLAHFVTSRRKPLSGEQARYAHQRGRDDPGHRYQAGRLSSTNHEDRAVTRASREIVALDDGMAKIRLSGAASALAGNPTEYGLLAGVGTALGLLVPSRRRVHA